MNKMKEMRNEWQLRRFCFAAIRKCVAALRCVFTNAAPETPPPFPLFPPSPPFTLFPPFSPMFPPARPLSTPSSRPQREGGRIGVFWMPLVDSIFCIILPLDGFNRSEMLTISTFLFKKLINTNGGRILTPSSGGHRVENRGITPEGVPQQLPSPIRSPFPGKRVSGRLPRINLHNPFFFY